MAETNKSLPNEERSFGCIEHVTCVSVRRALTFISNKDDLPIVGPTCHMCLCKGAQALTFISNKDDLSTVGSNSY